VGGHGVARRWPAAGPSGADQLDRLRDPSLRLAADLVDPSAVFESLKRRHAEIASPPAPIELGEAVARTIPRVSRISC